MTELRADGRRCSCSRTSTGPTRRRSTSCGCSPARSRPCRRSSSPPTATTSSTAAIRSGSCSASSPRARCVRRLALARALSEAVARARRAARHRRRRAAPQHRRQSVLRHARCLRQASAEIPPTVRDAVLARAARLEPEARGAAGGGRDRAAARRALAARSARARRASAHLDECLASGMLVRGADGVAFRHELARLAVEESLAPDRAGSPAPARARRAGGPRRAQPDLARLAHHAEAAGDAAPSSASRPRPAARRRRSAPIARLRPSTRARCASPMPSPLTSARSCSSQGRRVLPHRPAGGGDRLCSGRGGLLPRAGRPSRRRPFDLVRVVDLVVPWSDPGG